MTFYIVSIIQLVFTLALLGVEVWALIQAARFPSAAYDAAFKRTKGFWLAMTGGAVALGLIAGFGPGFGFLTLMVQVAALCMAGVFLADVLPALRTVMGRAQGNSRRR